MKHKKTGYGVPFGLMLGTTLAILLNLIFNIPLVYTLTVGPGFGLLAGIIIEGFVSKDDV